MARIGDTLHIACFAVIGEDRLDLGGLMIATGFAVASLRPDGLPCHAAYAVDEQTARTRRAGLWQFKKVRHPAILLGQAANGKVSRP